MCTNFSFPTPHRQHLQKLKRHQGNGNPTPSTPTVSTPTPGKRSHGGSTKGSETRGRRTNVATSKAKKHVINIDGELEDDSDYALETPVRKKSTVAM